MSPPPSPETLRTASRANGGERVPLFDRAPGDTVLIEAAGPISRIRIERRVNRLAARLRAHAGSAPGVRHALNLCDDRRHFLTSFAAVIAAGCVNLLPPNRQRDTVAGLVERYPDVFIVHDGSVAGLELPCAAIDVRPAANQASGEASGEAIEPTAGRGDDARTPRPSARRDALAAISFTSGSTGVPGANPKRWGALIDGTAINARAMLDPAPAPCGRTLTVLATVPPQHMYGLELSVLLPMRAPVCVANGQPLYPADVAACLERLPRPRALVTTPAHLRALVASNVSLPPVERVFSATAPLSCALAQESEHAFRASLIEIYGCSEVGSVARRRSAHEEVWQVFDGLSLTPLPAARPDGISYRVSAPHLGTAPELQDTLEIVSPGRFRLAGRQGDLLNVAGKRGSLAEITRRLLQAPGVLDAVAFQIGHGRLAAIVVAPDGHRDAILGTLRSHLDPVFLPRPLLFTDRLPRQPSSKLLAGDVRTLYEHLLGVRDRA